MMKERLLWDRFLCRIRESGLIKDAAKILDVGTGINTTILEMFGDRWDVTPSDVNVGEWNSHIPGMIEMDANRLSEGHYERWDVIILSEVLEHVVYPPRVLKEAFDALRPDGLLVISTPFMYRIHEYGNHDPETSEPGLKDYWRFTPSGMELLLRQRAFEAIWVGRLVDGDKRTFPEWECPSGVVAWAKKGPITTMSPAVIPEDEWKVNIPDNWRKLQTEMAEAYARSIEDA